MMNKKLCLLAISIIGGRCLCSEATDGDGIFRQYPFGDPRNCLQSEAVKTTQDDIPLNIMQVLPGTGWDNLRNVDAGYPSKQRRLKGLPRASLFWESCLIQSPWRPVSHLNEKHLD